MPVTAKLSRKFYEALGDDVANELVAWFNSVDATYRSDLKELNELNFTRFRAEMEGGFARADAKLEQRTSELRQEITQHSTALRAEIYALRAHVDTGFERLRTEMAGQRADLIKWMFVFWAPTVLAVLGLYVKR